VSTDFAAMHGLYLEDLKVGMSAMFGKTVTEADIAAFAGVSGDTNPIHLHGGFAQGTRFGQRIAHGLCVLSIASGLAVQTGIMEGTILAFREIIEWKFVAPVFIGDTVHVDLEVLETKALPRLSGGAITLLLDVRNQDDKTVQKGRWIALMLSGPQS